MKVEQKLLLRHIHVKWHSNSVVWKYKEHELFDKNAEKYYKKHIRSIQKGHQNRKRNKEIKKTKPAKPKNRRKPKHPNRNQPTKSREEQYIIARALLPFLG